MICRSVGYVYQVKILTKLFDQTSYDKLTPPSNIAAY